MQARPAIVDLPNAEVDAYLCCLDPPAPGRCEARERRAAWYGRMKDRGLVVKLAMVDGRPAGMIQAVPVERTAVQGSRLYLVLCLRVLGASDRGPDRRRRGLGTALLQAVEAEARRRGAEGIAAWGLDLPFFVAPSWFRRRGYVATDWDGGAALLWKPFAAGAIPPLWFRDRRRPAAGSERLAVTCFASGWCAALGAMCERARRAAAEHGDRVEFREIDTSDPEVVRSWGQGDALFVGDAEVRTGRPPTEGRIRWTIARRLWVERSRRAVRRVRRAVERVRRACAL